MCKPKLLAAVTACGLLAATAAFAHPQVITRSPEAGAAPKISPKEVRVVFSEALEIAMSTAKIEGSDGKAVAVGPLATGKANTALIVPVKAKLRPGTYAVSWEIVTKDVPGRYRFEARPWLVAPGGERRRRRG